MTASRMNSTLLGKDSPLQRARSRSRAGIEPPRDSASPRKRSRQHRVDPKARPLTRSQEKILGAVLAKEIDFIDSDAFYTEGAERQIYGLDEVERPDVSWYRPLMEDLIPQRGRGDQGRQGKSVILSA